MSNIENLFISALRNKVRFTSPRGLLSTEDLFELNLEALDAIAIDLDEKIQKASRKSFVAAKSASTTKLEAGLEIVKHVIALKQAEIEEQKNKKVTAERRAFLESLKNKKALEKLENMSEEEIDKQIAALS